jgi:hypothetical protein
MNATHCQSGGCQCRFSEKISSCCHKLIYCMSCCVLQSKSSGKETFFLPVIMTQSSQLIINHKTSVYCHAYTCEEYLFILLIQFLSLQFRKISTYHLAGLEIHSFRPHIYIFSYISVLKSRLSPVRVAYHISLSVCSCIKIVIYSYQKIYRCTKYGSEVWSGESH